MQCKLKKSHHMNNFFFNLLTTHQKFVEPKEFRHSLPAVFRDSYQQQDASEFFRFYLDQLEKSLETTPYKNLVNECFAGESEDTIECCQCQQPSRRNRNSLISVLISQIKTQTKVTICLKWSTVIIKRKNSVIQTSITAKIANFTVHWRSRNQNP